MIVYKIEKSWLELFYESTKPEDREEYLKIGIQEEGETEENICRKKILEHRYEGYSEDKIHLDKFIRAWLNIRFLSVAADAMFGKKKKIKKEMEQIKADFGDALFASFGELAEKLRYDEYCNMMRLYIEMCRDDKTYGSVILGFGRMKKINVVKKVADDIVVNTYVTPKSAGELEYFEPLNRAAVAMFKEIFPKHQDIIDEKMTIAQKEE